MRLNFDKNDKPSNFETLCEELATKWAEKYPGTTQDQILYRRELIRAWFDEHLEDHLLKDLPLIINDYEDEENMQEITLIRLREGF